jgi:hypothetical protein
MSGASAGNHSREEAEIILTLVNVVSGGCYWMGALGKSAGKPPTCPRPLYPWSIGFSQYDSYVPRARFKRQRKRERDREREGEREITRLLSFMKKPNKLHPLIS